MGDRLAFGSRVVCGPILRDIILSADEEELHKGAMEILFGLSFLSFAGECDLPVFYVGHCAL